MREYVVRGLAIIILIAVILLIAAVAWGPLGVFGMWLTFFVDAVTSADRVPAAAAGLWALWGAFIGGAIGLWMVAPSLGLESRRPLIIATPFVLLFAIAALAHI